MVRIVDMSGVDIANIQFDYDLVFAILFMNGNGRIYSRYGGRTPWNSESRVSLVGLKYTMRQVLDVHKPDLQPTRPASKTLLARELPSLGRSCIHCHQVWEGLRRQEKNDGRFEQSSLFVYPRAENIGLRLNVDASNVVVGVQRNSASDRAGLIPGDMLKRIGETRIFSEADVSWALHNAPDVAKLPLQYTRNDAAHVTTLVLEQYWKESNLSWRASMRKEIAPERHKK